MSQHEIDLRDKSVDELREMAKEQGISGAFDLRKEELVSAFAGSGRAAGGGSGGGLRTGPDSSPSVQYSQEITSPDDEPERVGRSLATTSHDVIRQWAEARGARPATVEGSEHDARAGVLRFDFGDAESTRLREISWEEWFETFDARGLNFVYQEQRSDGRQSNFFRLENPGREDA